ncbi:hypothetical protein [Streptomyces sp. NPDC058157]
MSTVTHFPTIYMTGVTQFSTRTITRPMGLAVAMPTGRARARLSLLFT